MSLEQIGRLNLAVILYSCDLLFGVGISSPSNPIEKSILATSQAQFLALVSFWLSNASTWNPNIPPAALFLLSVFAISDEGKAIIVMYGNSGGDSETCEVEKFSHVVKPLIDTFCILYCDFKSSEKSLTILENTIVDISDVHILI